MSNANKVVVDVELRAQLDQMRGGVKELEGLFKNLNLSPSKNAGMTQLFADMKKELKEIENLTEGGKISGKSFKKLEGSVDKVQNLWGKLTKEVQGFYNLTDKQKESLIPKDTSKQIDALTNGIKEYEKVLNGLNKTSGFNSLEKELSQVQKKAKELPDEIQKIQKAIEIAGQRDSFKKQFEEAEKEIADLESKLENFNKVQRNASEKGLGRPSEEWKAAQAQIPEVTKQLEIAKQKSAEAKQQFENSAIALERMGENGSSSVEKFTSKLHNCEGELSSAEDKIASLTNEIQKMGQSNATQAINAIIDKLSQIQGLNIDWKKITNIDDLQAKLNELVNQGFGEVVTILDQVTSSMESTGDANSQLKAGFDSARESIDKMSSSMKQIEQLAQRGLYFFGLTNTVNLLKKAYKDARKVVEELDESMTKTAVVTDFSVGDMWKQLPEYSKIATQYSSTLKDAYDVMTLYYQQGLETNQVFAVGEQTMKMARIAGLDYEEATDRMTNALRGFNMEVNNMNAEHIADVYSKLAAMSASNVKELSVAMTKTASLANSANMSFDNTAAFLAQIIETTRESAETAGTALKTVIARFSEVKSLFKEGDLIGDVEGEEVNINKVGAALRAAGVDLNEFMTGAKGLDEIFIELASKWDSLDLLTQRYIATMAAGSRQQSRFLALMSDNERLTELLNGAYNAAGASTQQFQKTEESLESKTNKLRNAWNAFLMSIANSSIIKKGADVLTKIVTVLNKFLDGIEKIGGSTLKSVASITLMITTLAKARTVIEKLIGVFAPKLLTSLGVGEGGHFAKKFLQTIQAGFQHYSGKPITVPIQPTEDPKGFLSKIQQSLLKNNNQKIKIPIEATTETANVAEKEGEAAARAQNTAAINTENQAIAQNNALESKSITLSIEEAKANLTQAQMDLEVAKATAVAANSKEVEAQASYELAIAKMTELKAKEASLKIERDQLIIDQQIITQQIANAKSEKEKAALEIKLAEITESLKQKEHELASVRGSIGAQTKKVTAEENKLAAARLANKKASGDLANAEKNITNATKDVEQSMTAAGAAGTSSFLSILGTIWPLLVALGLLAAATAVAWHFSEENQTQKKIELINEAAKEASDTVSSLNSAISTLKTSWDGIENGVDTLDSLTKGTSEWYSQLIANNAAVQELANSYEELSLEIGSDGQLSINKKQYEDFLKVKEEQLKQATKTSAIISAASTYETTKATNERNFKKQIREEAKLYVGSGEGWWSWFGETVSDAWFDSAAAASNSKNSKQLQAEAEQRLSTERIAKDQQNELQRQVAISTTAAALEMADYDKDSGKSTYTSAAYKYAAEKMYESTEEYDNLIDKYMKMVPDWDTQHDFELSDTQTETWIQEKGYKVAGGKVFDQEGNEIDYKSKTAEIAYSWASKMAEQEVEGFTSSFGQAISHISTKNGPKIGQNLSKILTEDYTADINADELLNFNIDLEDIKALGYETVEEFQAAVQEKAQKIADEQQNKKVEGVETLLQLGTQDNISAEQVNKALNIFKNLSAQEATIAAQQLQEAFLLGNEEITAAYVDNFELISQNLNSIDTSSLAALQSTLRDIGVEEIDIPIIDKYNSFVKSGTLDSLSEQFDEIVKANGAINPKNLLELAKGSKQLAYQLGYTTKEWEKLSKGEKVARKDGEKFFYEQAIGWAHIITAVQQGKIAYDDINESLLKMASSGRNSVDVLTELQDHINNFNPGVSNQIGYDFYSSNVEAMDKLAEDYAWGDQQFEAYILDAIEPKKEIQNNKDIKEYYNLLKQWNSNNGEGFWSATKLGNDSSWLENETTESAVKKIKDAIFDSTGEVITDAYAEAQLENFLSGSTEARKTLQTNDVNEALNKLFENGASQVNFSEDQLNTMASLMGMTASQMQQFIDKYNEENKDKNVNIVDNSSFYDKNTGQVLTGQELFNAIKEANIGLATEKSDESLDLEMVEAIVENSGLNKDVQESYIQSLEDAGQTFKQTAEFYDKDANSFEEVSFEGTRDEIAKQIEAKQKEIDYKASAEAIVEAFKANPDVTVQLSDQSQVTLTQDVQDAVNNGEEGQTVTVTLDVLSSKTLGSTVAQEINQAAKAGVTTGLMQAGSELQTDADSLSIGSKVSQIITKAVKKGFSNGLAKAKLTDEGKQALSEAYGQVFNESIEIALQLDSEKLKNDVKKAVSNGIGEVKNQHIADEEKTIIKSDFIQAIINAITENNYAGFNEATKTNITNSVKSAIQTAINNTNFNVPTNNNNDNNGETTTTQGSGKNGSPLAHGTITTSGPLYNRHNSGGVVKDETALVGEEGPELIQLKNGGAYLSGTQGPEMVSLHKGDIIYPNDETKKIYSRGGSILNRYEKGIGPSFNRYEETNERVSSHPGSDDGGDSDTEENTDALKENTDALTRMKDALKQGGVWTAPLQLAIINKQMQLLRKQHKLQMEGLDAEEAKKKVYEDQNKALSELGEKWADGDLTLQDIKKTIDTIDPLGTNGNGLKGFIDSFKGTPEEMAEMKKNFFNPSDEYYEYASEYDQLGDERDQLVGDMVDKGVEMTNTAIEGAGQVAQSFLQMMEKVAQSMVDGFKSFLGWLTIRIDDEHDINELNDALKNRKELLDWEFDKLAEKDFDYTKGMHSKSQENLFENINDAAQNVLIRLQNQRRLYENSFRQLEDLGTNINSDIEASLEEMYEALYGIDGIFTKINDKVQYLEQRFEKATNWNLTNLREWDPITKINELFGTHITDDIADALDPFNFFEGSLIDKFFRKSLEQIAGLEITEYRLGNVGESLLQKIANFFYELSPKFDADYQIVNKSELVDALNQKMNTIITNGTITSQFVQNYLDYLTEIESQMESEVDNIRNAETEILSLYDEMTEILEKGKDEYTDLEQQIYDAIVSEKESLKEELEELNSNITDADSNLIDVLKTNLDQMRQQRDNDQTERDLRDKEARLAYLKQDTSGANKQEILKLEKELEEGQQSYTDKLIDQKISELEKQNQEAADQRQIQIDLLQEEINNTKAIWEKVKSMMDAISGNDSWDDVLKGEIKQEAYYDIIEQLKKSSDFEDKSAFAQGESINEWGVLIRKASLYGTMLKDEYQEMYNDLKVMRDILDTDTKLPIDHAADSGWHDYVAFSNLETAVKKNTDAVKNAVSVINRIVDAKTLSFDETGSIFKKATESGAVIQAASGLEDAMKNFANDLASGLPGILTQVTTGFGNLAKGALKAAGAAADTAAGAMTLDLAVGDLGEGFGMVMEGVSNLFAAGCDAASLMCDIIGDTSPGFTDMGVAAGTMIANWLDNAFEEVDDHLRENVDKIMDEMFGEEVDGSRLGGYYQQMGIQIEEQKDALKNFYSENNTAGHSPSENNAFADNLFKGIEDHYQDIYNQIQRLDANDIEGFNKQYSRFLALQKILDKIGHTETVETYMSDSIQNLEKWAGETGSIFAELSEKERQIVVDAINNAIYDVIKDETFAKDRSKLEIWESNLKFKKEDIKYYNDIYKEFVDNVNYSVDAIDEAITAINSVFYDPYENEYTSPSAQLLVRKLEQLEGKRAEQEVENNKTIWENFIDGASEAWGEFGGKILEIAHASQNVINKIFEFLGKNFGDGSRFQDAITNLIGGHAIGGAIRRAERALVGELGPELVQHADGTATLVGRYGPEMANLRAGDEVYTAEQTKRILKSGGQLDFNRFAEGTVGTLMARPSFGLAIGSLDIGSTTRALKDEAARENNFNLSLNLEGLTVDSVDRVEEVANKVWDKLNDTVSGAMWPYNRL